ncbi:MAG: deoxyribodipyrimidine photolyase [Betaproteobacteria bacterium SG8_39]|nr:MAG: deoxyribodipyrimidine photolyase [Betaproteobacteria bacterium SG8_39]
MVPSPGSLVWFRRDLRADDHAALHAALRAGGPVHCVFVFDTEILDALQARADRRVEFIWESVKALRAALETLGGGLHVLHGRAREAVPQLAARLGVAAVYANRDYEPQALSRDAEVAARLAARGLAFHTRKDQVIFERGEVQTRAGGDFSVYTPYKRAWLAKLTPFYLKPYPVHAHRAQLAAGPTRAVPTLEALGFQRSNLRALGIEPGAPGAARTFAAFKRRIDRYKTDRDFPAVQGTSGLSVHLRFGTVSARELARFAWQRKRIGAQTWLSELIWRDFYFAVLAARPDVVDAAFRPEYNAIVYDDNDRYWRAWCEGQTGYPLVDAAMRQLNQTGFMHNRLRMVSASFLVKDLGIAWQRGERYFAARLTDYDLAANNGGWQWAASTGCDAQPWFRIFNPVTQSTKFDADGAFIRRFVPELAQLPTKSIHAPWRLTPLEQQAAGCVIGRDYPAPIVDHDAARKRTLARYGVVRKDKAAQ